MAEEKRKPENRRNPHIMEMRPEELTDKERHWHDLFGSIDFSDERSMGEYPVIAEEFFKAKREFSEQKEKEFLEQRASDSPILPEELMDFLKKTQGIIFICGLQTLLRPPN